MRTPRRRNREIEQKEMDNSVGNLFRLDVDKLVENRELLEISNCRNRDFAIGRVPILTLDGWR